MKGNIYDSMKSEGFSGAVYSRVRNALCLSLASKTAENIIKKAKLKTIRPGVNF